MGGITVIASVWGVTHSAFKTRERAKAERQIAAEVAAGSLGREKGERPTRSGNER